MQGKSDHAHVIMTNMVTAVLIISEHVYNGVFLKRRNVHEIHVLIYLKVVVQISDFS